MSVRPVDEPSERTRYLQMLAALPQFAGPAGISAPALLGREPQSANGTNPSSRRLSSEDAWLANQRNGLLARNSAQMELQRNIRVLRTSQILNWSHQSRVKARLQPCRDGPKTPGL